MYIMKRYQVYLNSGSVQILDEFESYTRVPRSELIREAIDRLAENLSKLLVAKAAKPKKFILDSLVGAFSIGSGENVNLSTKHDQEYLAD